MKEENIVEQPEDVETQNLSENENGSTEESLQDVDNGSQTSEAERGVPIGKFKSVEDLYDAYNNLQAEFTRKSQRLSALEKDKMTETPSNELSVEDKFKLFLSEKPEAFLYADELKSRVEQNENLKNDASAYDKVWAELLYEKLTATNLAKEPLVQNLILKDNGIRNLIVEDYMKQLQENKTPVVMSANSGERVTKTVAPKPDSFEQAKKVVIDLLS